MGWHLSFLTLFPNLFPGPLAHSVTGRALHEKRWTFKVKDIRDFATDKHKTVDEPCYGGGAGMLLKPEVVHAALTEALADFEKKPVIVYVTPKGRPLKQSDIKHWMQGNPSGMIILCGRYEGIDDRVIEHWRNAHDLQEISIGDYILSGGEMAAYVIADACIRLLPGVLGNEESLVSESFELDLLEFPHYTKPRNWQGKIVPDVLLSGDHQKIAAWRHQKAQEITQERRPDLWETHLRNQSALSEIGQSSQGEDNESIATAGTRAADETV